MSLSKSLLRASFLASLLMAATALGACSGFTPVYSGALAAQPNLALAYATPTSRLEQLVYQDLSLRLGQSSADTAPLITVTVQSGGTTGTRSQTQDPREARQIAVNATLVMQYRDGSQRLPLTITRRASANYTFSGQVLGDTGAVDEAAERAAKAVAESLRLALLAELGRA